MSRVMSAEKLDRLLSAASDFDASDLHLVAGVPPAFRVNGEIIIADEDVLTERDVADIADFIARSIGLSAKGMPLAADAPAKS